MPLLDHRAAFGRRVRALREERGYSQEGFAHRAGLDRTYVSGIERGRRNPTLDVIHRFADALGVELSELFPHDVQKEPADLYQPPLDRLSE